MNENDWNTNTGKGLVPEEQGRALRRYPQSPEVLRAYPVEEEADLRKYLDVIWRRKNIILTFFVVVVVTTLIGSLIAKPVYKATAKLEIAREDPNILKFEEVFQIDGRSLEFYETQFILLKSKSLAKQIIDKLNLLNHPEFSNNNEKPSIFSNLISGIKGIITKAFNRKNVNGRLSDDIGGESILVNKFLDRVEISPIGESRVVDISFEANDPKLSAEAVNSLANGFIEWNLNRKVEATKEGRKFLKKQLEHSQINLEKSEEELNEFSKKSDIISLDKNMNLTYHQLSELNDALAKAETERIGKESLHKHVLNGNPEAIPAVVNDDYIQGLKAEHAKINAEHSQLTAIFKPEYPKVKESAAKVAEMKAKIDEATNSIVASIQSDYGAAVKREELLRKRHQKQKGLASSLNEKAVQYKIFQREVDTNKSIYDSLLQRLKETEVSAGVQASNIQVVDYASTPISPFKPRILLNLLLACIIGLFGGVFIAFMMEYFDNSVKDLEDIRDDLRLPVLGGIFNVDKEKDLNFPLEKAFLLAPKSHFAEAFRTIRVSLLLSTPGNPPRTLLITSSRPQEGKTTVSINLAVSFAQAGSRVLLLETDFRRPRIGHVFGKNGLGLTSYLTGNASLEEIINKVDIPNLSIITTGQLPVNPAELLGSEEMKNLIENLSEKYDFTILDGPPIIGIADALILSSITNGTVVVANAGSTPRDALRGVIERLWSFNSRVLGVILNRMDAGRQSYYYKNAYYYNYETKKTKDLSLEEPNIDSNNQGQPPLENS
ncbi:polysaccharide biosynthesis tyrosine autokinase [Desulfobacterota bacterium AH_259_B03_O07]|nr:polysaccharide biosynthesis tyrosine autokinase [Desulfobacterota bacterium AH_259_B03_O07]